MNTSKPLGHADTSGFDFIQSALGGDTIGGINIDVIMYHPGMKRFIFIELCRTGADQTVTPYSSHPNKYWWKNHRKFESQWRLVKAVNAHWLIINYCAEEESEHYNKVRIIHVKDVTENGIVEYDNLKDKGCWTRDQFSEWYRHLNAACKQEEIKNEN